MRSVLSPPFPSGYGQLKCFRPRSLFPHVCGAFFFSSADVFLSSPSVFFLFLFPPPPNQLLSVTISFLTPPCFFFLVFSFPPLPYFFSPPSDQNSLLFGIQSWFFRSQPTLPILSFFQNSWRPSSSLIPHLDPNLSFLPLFSSVFFFPSFRSHSSPFLRLDCIHLPSSYVSPPLL